MVELRVGVKHQKINGEVGNMERMEMGRNEKNVPDKAYPMILLDGLFV